MPLPSQSRSFGSRSSSKRRRKKGPPKAVFIVPVALIGVVGTWWAIGGSGEKDANDAAARAADDALASVTEVVPQETVLEPEPQPRRAEAPVVEEPKVDPRQPSDETVLLGAQPKASPTETQRPPAPRPDLVALTTPQSEQRFDDELPPADPIAQPTAGTASVLQQAAAHMDRGELVSARALLNEALRSPSASEDDRQRVRDDLTTINQELFFGSKVYPGDTVAELYEVQSGDSLAKITYRQGLAVDWRLIQRINRISDPSRIRVGQKLKLVRGPVHAVVTKSDYRIDLYVGPPGAESQWTYLRSFNVGLGELDSTPLGEFVVRTDSKLINPVWRNPRTGEFFAADDPKNPIGERWVGIEGVGQYASLEGYGIHGTIDPASIGRDASMGCVRMNNGDVDLVYEMLEEQVSQVVIRP